MTLHELSNTNTYFHFYGAVGNYFKLGSCIFEAIRDEDDGYRSCLDYIPLTSSQSGTNFLSSPLDIVQITSDDNYVYLIAPDKHIWLTIGTDFSNSRYPYFVFAYNPRKDQTTFYTEEQYSEACPIQLLPELFL